MRYNLISLYCSLALQKNLQGSELDGEVHAWDGKVYVGSGQGALQHLI